MSYFAHSDELPEWVAQTPEGWDRNWLKWSIDLSTERPAEEEKETLPYISNEDIAPWTGKLLAKELEPAEVDSRRFRENDILFNKLRPYLAKVYHARFSGTSSGELLCLRPSNAVESRFIFYVLMSKGFIDTVNAETFGSKMPRADWEIVGHQPLPLPPLDTQRRIARFLDEKTGQIDALIEKKRELLDRLAEKRRTVITLAVTKGLLDSSQSDRGGYHLARRGDCQAVERANGMTEVPERVRETYREFPQDWSSKRLKYLATHNDEVLAESTDEEKDIDYVEISGVSLSYGIEEIERMSFGSAPSRARRRVRSGDILISTVRTYLRAIVRVNEASPDLIASTGFCVVRPNDDVDSGFLGWVVKSEPFVSEVVARSVGVSYPAINASELITIEIPLPPLDTQRRIVQFLDEKTGQIDALIEKIRDSIVQLEEYRSAQITAAVTGQAKTLI